MKLVRYGEPGRERPGMVDSHGRIRDLSNFVPDISGAVLDSESLGQLAVALTAANPPLVEQPVRLGPCVSGVGKIICVGLNYREHIREVGASAPAEPVLFMKATTALCGPFDRVVIPDGATAVDWEVELGVVIGRRANRIGKDQARSFIAGFCVVNDLSERDWQLKGTGQWVKGKSADTFAPIGPWLVTQDEIRSPHALRLQLSVNGQIQQSSNTGDMVFDIDFLVSYISRYMTLMPGDIISTGTPPGVGMGKNPPRYLQEGDQIELSIDGLGTQRQMVASAATASQIGIRS